MVVDVQSKLVFSSASLLFSSLCTRAMVDANAVIEATRLVSKRVRKLDSSPKNGSVCTKTEAQEAQETVQ